MNLASLILAIAGFVLFGAACAKTAKYWFVPLGFALLTASYIIQSVFPTHTITH
jgi:hypothetical protein